MLDVMLTRSLNGINSADVLADEFQLTNGRVEITVPDVAPGCGYQIVRKYRAVDH